MRMILISSQMLFTLYGKDPLWLANIQIARIQYMNTSERFNEAGVLTDRLACWDPLKVSKIMMDL